MNQDRDDGKKTASRNAQDPRARRRLVKSLAASGGLAAVGKAVTDWNKPIVESVLLPAHAQTTGAQVYQLGCRVLYSVQDADATANSGEQVSLGVIDGGFGSSLELFQINQVEATLLLNGTPVPSADICISITETAGAADVDVDEAPFAGGAVHTVQTAASGTATVGGPFPVDEDALSVESFNVRVQFWECDNPQVPACMIDFAGSTTD